MYKMGRNFWIIYSVMEFGLEFYCCIWHGVYEDYGHEKFVTRDDTMGGKLGSCQSHLLALETTIYPSKEEFSNFSQNFPRLFNGT
jgi:hypothetical protein